MSGPYGRACHVPYSGQSLYPNAQSGLSSKFCSSGTKNLGANPMPVVPSGASMSLSLFWSSDPHNPANACRRWLGACTYVLMYNPPPHVPYMTRTRRPSGKSNE